MAVAALWQSTAGVAMGLTDADDKLTTTESAGKLAWALAHGEALSNRAAVKMTGLPYETTRQMLERLSRVLPIVFCEGVWYVVALDEMR